ncbi:MAG TPA: GNAT family protein [Dehalococcoidia bacterium]|nr:GNAT family protein [Dehalococcoidia bacterium]
MNRPDQPVLNITGEKVALGPLRRDLVPLYQRWLNDFAVTRTLAAGRRPFTLEAEEDWFQQASRNAQDLVFTLYELATLRPIGNAGLHRVDHAHGTAEFGIFIGEQDCWGRGYGTEATRLVIDYGFDVLGLHNIWLRAFSDNLAGLRAYARAGFREVGRLREAHRRGRERYDVVLMDCLAVERATR